MFVSLKRYIENRPEHAINALCRMVRQLLQAIGQHAIRADADDHDNFRLSIRDLALRFESAPPVAEIERMANEAADALAEYNARAAKRLRVQTAELQGMVEMLTKTMAAIASGAEYSISRLREIEGHLQKATAVEDFQTAKIRMSECLDTLRFEIEQRCQESARQVTELKTAINRSERRASALKRPAGRRDPVTDLPDRPEAEAILLEAAEARRTMLVAAFVLERIDLINMRFGHAAGDQVLVAYRQHLTDHMEPEDELFRWTGPAFVSLLARRDSISAARECLGKFASKRLAKSATFGSRSVLLPVEANWTVFSAADAHEPSALIRQIDVFIENAGAKARAIG